MGTEGPPVGGGAEQGREVGKLREGKGTRGRGGKSPMRETVWRYCGPWTQKHRERISLHSLLTVVGKGRKRVEEWKGRLGKRPHEGDCVEVVWFLAENHRENLYILCSLVKEV
jgi:hypothetical protein